MPTYDVYVHCKSCNIDHPALLSIHLDTGPQRKQSIAAIFHQRRLPPQVAAIRGHVSRCYKTGKTFRPQSDDEIFLVPPPHRPDSTRSEPPPEMAGAPLPDKDEERQK